jgi:IclR family transcriptional regulator, acetate operon repressor
LETHYALEINSNLPEPSGKMSIAAVQRCLDLLELLATREGGMELVAIADQLGIPVSATHRILATLIERGFVKQEASSQTYSLSVRLAQLAFGYLDCSALPDAGTAVLEALAKRTGDYCRLAIVEGDNLVWIARAQGATSGLRYDPDMGRGIVLHATATGKAWLSTLPENEALRVVFAQGFTTHSRMGPNVVQNVDELRSHLEESRRRGYAVAVEEGEIGTCAIAVPFLASNEADARVAGTLSVAGPVGRMRPDRYPEIVQALKTAAREMQDIWCVRRRQARQSSLYTASPSSGPSKAIA